VNPLKPFGALSNKTFLTSLDEFLSEIESSWEPLMIAASTSLLPISY
jgi:hypothetical protein